MSKYMKSMVPLLLIAASISHAGDVEKCTLYNKAEPEMVTYQNCISVGRSKITGGDALISKEVAVNASYDERGVAYLYSPVGIYYFTESGLVRRTIPYDNGPDYFEEGMARTERGGKIGYFNEFKIGQRVKYMPPHRIDEQRSWYANKSAWNRKKGRLWFAILIGCQAFAVLFLILRVAYPDWGYWPADVFVVAAGSALTWIQVKRFKELAAAYGLTAHEIGVVRGELEQIDSEEKLAQFVADSENAFSREHTQWLARKDSI